MKKTARIISIITINLITMLSCNNNNANLFEDSQKFLVGYNDGSPVFDAPEYHKLVYLKDKRSNLLYTYDSLWRPLRVVDSIVLFQTEGKLLLVNLNNDTKQQSYNLAPINVAYNPQDNCIYLNEEYDDKIFKFNTHTNTKTQVDARGAFLTVKNNYLFYYEYSNKVDVSTEIDLHRLNLSSGDIKHIRSNIAEEFISIAPDGESFITSNPSDSLYRDIIYDIGKNTKVIVEERAKKHFIEAFYSKEKKKFFYVNVYTLEQQEAK